MQLAVRSSMQVVFGVLYTEDAGEAGTSRGRGASGAFIRIKS